MTTCSTAASRRAGHHRGGRTPAARLHGQRGVTRRGVPRRRPAGGTGLQPSPRRGRDARSPTCCSPATTPDRALAARAGRAPAPRSAVRPASGDRCHPWSGRPRRTPRGPGRRRRALHATAGLLAAGDGGQPRRRHPALRESLDDVRRGLDAWVVRVVREPSSGRLVGCGARQGDSRGEGDIGRIMVAPDLQDAALGRALLELVEGPSRRPASTPSSSHRGRVGRQPADVQEAGFRLRPDRRAPPGAVV